MQRVISGIGHLALRSTLTNDDAIDQLHHFATASIMLCFAALTGYLEYAGQAIDCWNQGTYMWGHYMVHVNSYCWTHSLYQYPDLNNRSHMPFPLNEHGAPADPNVFKQRKKLGSLTFYRWVTVVFVAQAFCFKVPNLLWGEFNAYIGSNIIKMVEMLQSVLFAKREEKEEKIQQVALFLEQWLTIHRKARWFRMKNVSPFMKQTVSSCTVCIGNNVRNYLSTLYLLTKAMYLVNNALQFVLLSVFLQLDFWRFGVERLNLYVDQTGTTRVETAGIFPMVALCHFQVYDSTVVKTGATGKWVQCILNINVYLEKLFLVEWLWLAILFVMTAVSFCIWCFKILRTSTALKFVRRYMKLMGVYSKPKPVPPNKSLGQFVMEYLRNDGVFVLRILALNTNEVAVADLVEELWERYLEFEDIEPVPSSSSLDSKTKVEPGLLVEPDLAPHIPGVQPGGRPSLPPSFLQRVYRVSNVAAIVAGEVSKLRPRRAAQAPRRLVTWDVDTKDKKDKDRDSDRDSDKDSHCARSARSLHTAHSDWSETVDLSKAHAETRGDKDEEGTNALTKKGSTLDEVGTNTLTKKGPTL